MRLLLETHTFLWFVFGQKELSAVAAQAINDPSNTTYVSLVSMWEVAIKHARGRLELVDPPDVLFASGIFSNRFEYLPLRPPHVYRAAALHLTDHRDPFDRALVAQAMVEGMTLVSADQKLDRYDVSRLF